MRTDVTILTTDPVEATQDNNKWSAILLAMLPHLLFAFLTAFSTALIDSVPGAAIFLRYMLPVALVTVLLWAWWRGWPLWSGSWAGYWLLFAFAYNTWLSLPGLDLVFLFLLAAIVVFICQRRPLFGLLTSLPLLLLLPRFFVFELVAGGEWVMAGIWLLLALTAGVIVWRNSLRTGILLALGFHVTAGLAFALGRSYLPYRFAQMGPRQPPTLATLVNDFVPLTLAVITISLTLLLLYFVRQLAGQGEQRVWRNYWLLLLGMLLTLGGLFGQRGWIPWLGSPMPELASSMAWLLVITGVLLSLGATFLLTRMVWLESGRRFHVVLLLLLAALAPFTLFPLARPLAQVGQYSDSFQIMLVLSYVAVLFWVLGALLVVVVFGMEGNGRIEYKYLSAGNKL
jgi:hypothetical protein